MAFTAPVAIVPAGTVVTANGASAAHTLGASRRVSLLLDVTAASGTTPTLDVTVEWSHDGTTWVAAGDAFAQVTGTGAALLVADVKAPRVRLAYTVAGTTPSFTLGVTAAEL